MQIEVGKFYRTRDGEKMGPAERHLSDIYPWEVGGDAYTSDGFFLDGESSHRDLVAEWTEATPAEPASEIEWGEWGPMRHSIENRCDMQFQRIGDVDLWRYPVPKKPVVETVVQLGHNAYGKGWSFSSFDNFHDTARITFDVIDGKPDWSTLRGEDLA